MLKKLLTLNKNLILGCVEKDYNEGEWLPTKIFDLILQVRVLLVPLKG